MGGDPIPGPHDLLREVYEKRPEAFIRAVKNLCGKRRKR